MDMHPISAEEHLEITMLENEAVDLIKAAKALEGLLCLRNVRQIRGMPAPQYREALEGVISGMRGDLSRKRADEQELRVGGAL